ncbi:hypothetical protein DPQ33_18100 [Oceanidesulfovibrio indonesiensis]|uniref:Methyltransferase type 11 domain-containing protein n=1 Tax=Oceanidesulfovibrio indonesiensis TaxID=54767 RepID=A0A7M3M9W6_9BACT|nr:class I SAM-dependent methyltransferase [Oceanidesulfovibrio indonesiensis]TVM13816.1 hypothetical protein DPQ33_18100 [Oceanidesulfovibrio indonesiensis]
MASDKNTGGGKTAPMKGSTSEFHANWSNRPESLYNHWTGGAAKNQVQFAFKNHWQVFGELMGHPKPGASLEVGCGRGSLSSFFAQAGWDATLLDYSPAVIRIARDVFTANGHSGHFVTGDTLALPFPDESFDVVAHIGLLEHFEEPGDAVLEQWRVLRSGGWLLAYIVPEKPDNVQRHFKWVNVLLKAGAKIFGVTGKRLEKEAVYRNDLGSEYYMPIFEALEPAELFVSGMYSMPMISHSPEFPFSLLPAPMEQALVKIFGASVAFRKMLTGRHGWLCSEKNGQALLMAARK